MSQQRPLEGQRKKAGIYIANHAPNKHQLREPLKPVLNNSPGCSDDWSTCGFASDLQLKWETAGFSFEQVMGKITIVIPYTYTWIPHIWMQKRTATPTHHLHVCPSTKHVVTQPDLYPCWRLQGCSVDKKKFASYLLYQGQTEKQKT